MQPTGKCVFEDDKTDYIELVRKKKPLVQCITNFVSMDIMANILNALGASPAMVHAEEEVEEFMEIADCLNINVGTLTGSWLRSMKLAIGKANASGKPWVLDPVGAGATKFRTNAIHELLELGPTLVRGNASEIQALYNPTEKSKGVDSVLESNAAIEAAKNLALTYKTLVVVTGYHDYVTDGIKLYKVESSNLPRSESTTKISALGCSLTAALAAYLSVANPENCIPAVLLALCFFQFATLTPPGSYVEKYMGPGSFRIRILDILSGSPEDIETEEVRNVIAVSEYDLVQ